MAGSDVEQILATVDDKEFDEDDWNLAYVEIKRLAASWRDIGIALGISGHVLDEIAGNHHHQAGDCLASVLQKWIGQNYNTDKFGLPSWRTLCRAIQSVSDNKFFKDLARKHGGVVSAGGGGGGGGGGGRVPTSAGTTASASAPPSNEEALLSAKPKIGDFNIIKYKGKDGSKKRLHILSRGNHLWKGVASQLFPDEPNLVNSLGPKHQNNPTECLRELLQDFLSKRLPDEYTRDWNGLIELFKDLEEVALAEEIEEAVLNKGK